MNYSFIIRRAIPSDSEAIHKILLEAFKKYQKVTQISEDVEALKETIEDIKIDINKNYVFIALIDNIPVGTVRLKFLENSTALLSRFAVNLNYHNIGIGKSMINLIDKIAKNMNLKKVFLYTASKHYDLVKFYYNRGFHIDSTTKEKGYTRALMIKDF
ncbi:MAG: GNAT family N-acetyltransferase [Clostridiales bacterium]